MDWLIAALASTTLFGIVTFADKRLVDSYFPSVTSFNIIFGWLQFFGPLIVFTTATIILGFPTIDGAFFSLASGVFWAMGLGLFFYGLRMEEVSRATPIHMTFPIFAAVLAILFFGETLSLIQWVAIFFVVAGAGLVSYRPTPGRRGFIGRKAFLILLGGAFFTGMALVVTKQATDDVNVFQVQGLRGIGMGIAMTIFLVRPSRMAEVRRALSNKKGMLLLAISEGIVAPCGALLVIIALSLGPVSLVSAATSVRPLLVLIMSSALSTSYWNVLNEPLDKDTLGLKAISTILIVLGLTGLAVG